jgi:hypothetical protein
MDSMFPILIFVVFIVIFALFAYYSYQQRLQRVAELHALAQQLNWQFSGEEDYSFDSEYSQFSVFTQGSSGYAYNTLTGHVHIGDEHWPARMGDYHYQTTSSDGKTTHTHHHYFSYLLVDLPYPSLPYLRIRREGFFDTLAGAFGFSDINFESAEFSKRIHVKSSDKRFAYDVIHPAMMEFLLADDPPAIEIDGGCCCLTSGSDTWSAAEFRDRLNWAAKFFELWPRHLVAALRSR